MRRDTQKDCPGNGQGRRTILCRLQANRGGRVARGTRCKMGRTGDFAQAPDFGYCASQKTYYFGYKLHALCGLTGVVHSYDLSKASIPDLDYMKDVKLSYHDCSIYGDKACIGADQLTNFQTHQLPNSPTHQLITSSTQNLKLLFLFYKMTSVCHPILAKI